MIQRAKVLPTSEPGSSSEHLTSAVVLRTSAGRSSDGFLAPSAKAFIENLPEPARSHWLEEVLWEFIANPQRENTVPIEGWQEGELVTVVEPFVIAWRYENAEVLQVFAITFFARS